MGERELAEIIREFSKFPKGHCKITVFPKSGNWYVLKDNIPSELMIAQIGAFGAFATSDKFEYRVIENGVKIFFKFYPSCDYPSDRIKEEAIIEAV